MKTRCIVATRRACALGMVFALALSLLACTSMGVGSGSLLTDNTPVSFSWTSTDGGNTGTLSAMVNSGAAFSGPFLQMTSTVRTEALDPIWRGWHRGWGDWAHGGIGPMNAFATIYSGQVIANLQGPAEQRLRCRFHLNDPAAGMSGGGQGECQFNDGRTVQAVFPRS